MMKSIHSISDSWEAPYLEKPTFNTNLDFCYFENDLLVGILAGHQTQRTPYPLFSAEILAVHPQFQSRGIAKALLKYFFKKNTLKNIELHLWTRDPVAKNIYENHFNLHLINERHLSIKNQKNKQYWLLESPKITSNLWNYKITPCSPFITSP